MFAHAQTRVRDKERQGGLFSFLPDVTPPNATSRTNSETSQAVWTRRGGGFVNWCLAARPRRLHQSASASEYEYSASHLTFTPLLGSRLGNEEVNSWFPRILLLLSRQLFNQVLNWSFAHKAPLLGFRLYKYWFGFIGNRRQHKKERALLKQQDYFFCGALLNDSPQSI